MKKKIKSLFMGGEGLKIGDDVFLGGMDTEVYEHDWCPLCKEPTYEEINSQKLTIFKEEQLCESHKIHTFIEEISSDYMLRIERWRDEYKHYRAGLEWYGEDKYEFIVERPTLIECLEDIKDYIKRNDTKNLQIKKNKRTNRKSMEKSKSSAAREPL